MLNMPCCNLGEATNWFQPQKLVTDDGEVHKLAMRQVAEFTKASSATNPTPDAVKTLNVANGLMERLEHAC